MQPTQLSLLPELDPAPAAATPAAEGPARAMPAMTGQPVLPEPLAGAVVTVLARMIAHAAGPSTTPAGRPARRNGSDRR